MKIVISLPAMRHLIIYFLCCLSLLSLAQNSWAFKDVTTPAKPTKRGLALVIGNSAYSIKPLPNAKNDAQDMAAMLRLLGFEVILRENLSKDEMVTEVSDFSRRLQNYAVGLFYFAGHGFLSTQKDNYLMSVGIKASMNESFAKSGSVALEDIIGSMEEARSTPTKILIVDACRTNPYRSWGRSDQKGLGAINAPEGLLAFFAASPGEEADENPGKRNGLFTQELLRQLNMPNLSIDALIRNTANAVKKQNPAQRPYRVGDLSDVFYLNPTVRDLPPFMTMVRIPGGTFEMGSNESDNEKPIHRVTVSGFMMGKYEVTVGQFAQFVEESRYQTDAEKGDGSYVVVNGKLEEKADIHWRHDEAGNERPRSQYEHPVIHVSHNDAVAFCEWLSRKEGKTYRLPTEAEWEYAAGGGSSSRTKWSGTNSESALAEVGNFCDANCDFFTTSSQSDGYAYSAPVGIFKANSLGLHDMSGNVSEWCADWNDKSYYAISSSSNPTGPVSGAYRVLRGGSSSEMPNFARVADRSGATPDDRNFSIGFRIVSRSQ